MGRHPGSTFDSEWFGSRSDRRPTIARYNHRLKAKFAHPNECVGRVGAQCVVEFQCVNWAVAKCKGSQEATDHGKF
jgi:hypothetical protein